jgi:hypothetical protein
MRRGIRIPQLLEPFSGALGEEDGPDERWATGEESEALWKSEFSSWNQRFSSPGAFSCFYTSRVLVGR